MKNYLIFLFFCATTIIVAQPSSGIKLGTNLTFIEDSKIVNYSDPNTSPGNILTNTYSSSLGWQLGYAWNINLNKYLSISFESLLIQRKAQVKTYLNDVYQYEEKKNALYLNIPIALNYYINSFYSGMGYEFGYDTALGNGLHLNNYEHSLFLQAGYKIWRLDLIAKYGIILNNETSRSGISYSGQPTTSNSVPNYSSLQFYAIFNLGKNSNAK